MHVSEKVPRRLRDELVVYLGNPGSEITPDKELVPLQLGLDDDEGKVGLGIHVASHLLNLLNLGLDPRVNAID